LLRAAQLLVSGQRGPAAVNEVVALICGIAGATSVTLRSARSGAEVTVAASALVSTPQVTRLTLPLSCGGEDLGTLSVNSGQPLTLVQEQTVAVVADLLALHLMSGFLAEQLSQAALERRRLVVRFIDATEREREQLAGELHDGPLQSLVAARYVTDMAGLAVRDGSFDEARQGVQDGLVSARRALWQLRPHAADGIDLAGALHNLGGQLGESAGLRVTVSSEDLPAVIPPSIGSAAFRLVQEMLRTSALERAATAATVAAEVDGGVLVVTVTDDGVGQVVEVAPGLARWREWVSLLGGDVRLRGKRGGGAWLRARLPLSDEAFEKAVKK
jgi:signal transduction histidine kinase